jgi:hypothetical protein
MRRWFFILTISLSIVILGCNNSDKYFNAKVVSILKEFGRNSKVLSNIENEGNKELKIFFKSPTYLDKESQKLTLVILSSRLYKYLKDFKSVNYIIIDEGFDHEPLSYTISDSDLNVIYSRFQDNSLFEELLKYSFNNIDQNELIKCNIIIEEMHKLMPETFDFQGSFWLLLEKFSLAENEDSKDWKYFIMFYNVVKVKEFNVNHEHIKRLIDFTHQNKKTKNLN